MKYAHSFFRFLGGIHLAIALIAMTALFVIAGTLIESRTESHRYAALFTYGNPVFGLLLWGFFINILVSALRRWPFQTQHIPFLITHFGLLMILGGCLIKNFYGTQGALSLIEGGGGHTLMMPDTYVVYLEKRDPSDPFKKISANYPLKRNWLGAFYIESPADPAFSELQLTLLEYRPHSRERLDSWIKGDMAFINGLAPFPVYDLDESLDPAPISARAILHHPQSPPWDILAGRVNDVAAAAAKIYIEGAAITLSDPLTRSPLFKGSLKEALSGPIALPDGSIALSLHFNYSPLSGFEEPQLALSRRHHGRPLPVNFSVALQGDESLLNTSLKAGSLDVDIHRTPLVLLLQDPNEDVFFFAFDPHGQVYADSFGQDRLQSVISYDQGFGGYAVQAQLPFPSYPAGRQEREAAALHHLDVELRQGLQNNPELSPPLKLLQTACAKAKTDFVSNCLDFMDIWSRSGAWLYPLSAKMPDNLSQAMRQLDWSAAPPYEKNSCLWAHSLCSDLEAEYPPGGDFNALLKQRGWPLEPAPAKDDQAQFTTLVQQIFSVGDQLPDAKSPESLSDSMQARLLSAYFQAYGLHLRNIIEPPTAIGVQPDVVTLEAPLTPRQRDEPPRIKLEDNTPKATLQVRLGSHVERVTLSYERFGRGLKWPIFNGKYLIRFQSEFREIPYHVRLRNARQINYALSAQPYSYESDLLITDLQRQTTIEKTISMNNVHETWDGYRFYLANIAPPNEGAVKQVQILVNHDPAKYWLTYPGAIILSLGVILLFWLKR